jgi:hypothetical protein
MAPEQQQAAESAIKQALLSYCRGIDRLDADAVLAAFHPGAELIDYGPEPTTIEAFADRAMASLARFTTTQHRVSNINIEFGPQRSDRALVESYVLAFHVEPGADDGPDRLLTFNGRYIDRFEERDGAWRVATRHLRLDWSRVETIDQTMGGAWVPSGRAGSPDPIYD